MTYVALLLDNLLGDLLLEELRQLLRDFMVVLMLLPAAARQAAPYVAEG
jgi:hypothetical protein